MRSPLIKRVPREFIKDYKKYIAVFLFLTIMIAFAAGDYVASDSMMAAINGSYEKYNTEDGNFRTDEPMSSELIKAIESGEDVDSSIDSIVNVDDLIDDYLEDSDINEIIDEFKKNATKEDLKNSILEGIDKEEFIEEYKSELDKDEFLDNYKTQIDKDEFVVNYLQSQGITDITQDMIDSIDADAAIDEYISTLDVDAVIDEYFEKVDIDELIDAYIEEKSVDEIVDDMIKDMSEEDIKEEIRKSLDKNEFLDDLRDEVFEDYDDGSVATIKIYEKYYKDVEEDINLDGKRDATIRVFKIRDEVDKACINEGRLPEKNGEIAIDRMHADNRDIKIGDTIKVSGKEFKVVGMIALPDYTSLFQKNTDSMFDAINFNVSVVKGDVFDSIDGKINYCYSWKYDDRPESKKKEKEISEHLMDNLARKVMINGNSLEDYVPNYSNSAIQFAPEDVGGDSVMMKILIYILIAVIAFIFAVTINNTIENESAVIGTLRASGYSRGELLLHYLSIPVIVTLCAATVGNILGYTKVKDMVVNLYYESYSLPKYETLWNQKAFLETTIVPIVLMFVINTYMIYAKLKLSPLRFLRHDLGKHKRKKAMRLPRISFFGRFRLRILLHNKMSYFIMMFGIFFTTVLLVFTQALPETLDHYKDIALEEAFSKYQYVLKSDEDEDGNKIKTKNKDAKYVAINTLVTNDKYEEEVMVYGMDMDETKSLEYKNVDEGEILISTAYRDKFDIKCGDIIKLKEKYEGDEYEFKVVDFYNAGFSISVFMNRDEYISVFDEEEGFFNSILSESEVTDIDEKYIYMSVTPDDITKVSRQLEHSMGAIMDFFKYFLFVLALVLMYLITKIIIERNAQSISMVKVLGYTNGEVNKLYIITTALVVAIVAIISEFFAVLFIGIIWKIYLKEMSGWIPMYVSLKGVIVVYVIVMVAFAVVTFFDVMRIKKVPLTAALKNVE